MTFHARHEPEHPVQRSRLIGIFSSVLQDVVKEAYCIKNADSVITCVSEPGEIVILIFERRDSRLTDA